MRETETSQSNEKFPDQASICKDDSIITHICEIFNANTK